MQPDYALMRQLLADAAPALSPSSLHGALCGHLCSGAAPELEVFHDLFETQLPDVVLRLLARLGDDTRMELLRNDYAFQPLLPDDENALGERLLALAEWCDWFNVGFAAGYMQPQTPLSVDVMEILNDFSQLAEVEAPDAGSEDDERYLVELVEYVRMAALTVFQQMREALGVDAAPAPTRDPDPDQLTH